MTRHALFVLALLVAATLSLVSSRARAVDRNFAGSAQAGEFVHVTIEAATSVTLRGRMAATVRIGDLTVNRLGFGAMRVCGPDIWGPPKDRANAHRVFRRAIELTPNFADVYRFYSVFLGSTGRRDQGMTEIKRALDLDPHSPVYQVNYGMALFHLGHDDAAIAVWQKLLRTDPDFTLTHAWLWNAFYKKGMYAQAIAEARKSVSTEISDVLGRRYAEGGYQQAMHMAAETAAARVTRRYAHPTRVARLYADAGEKDHAIDWLERAYEERDSQLIFLHWPQWDSLRDNPRFQDLLRRMDLPR